VGATEVTIWRVPAYLAFLQPPLTEDATRVAERQIGYPLPAEYLALLRRQNGGYIRFSLPEMVHDKIAGIGPHSPSLTRFDWEDFQQDVSFPLEGLVPFDGDGHWHLCLDYRNDSQCPSVTFADIASDRESPVADSFAGYLRTLQVKVGEEYVLEGVSDIERIKADLSSSLETSFDPPDSWAHGYPTHRARLGPGTVPEWVWITPNRVPRGFVRPDHPRFKELKGLMPGEALRFPEVSPDGYILSTTDAVRARVLEACVPLGVRVRRLSDFLRGS
jgi:hypothetical protein